LTEQHLEILSLIVQGKSNRDVSDLLEIPYWRVPKICTGIYWELQTHGRLDTKVRYDERTLPPDIMHKLDEMLAVKEDEEDALIVLPGGSG
jgi:hypothetical protein